MNKMTMIIWDDILKNIILYRTELEIINNLTDYDLDEFEEKCIPLGEDGTYVRSIDDFKLFGALPGWDVKKEYLKNESIQTLIESTTSLHCPYIITEHDHPEIKCEYNDKVTLVLWDHNYNKLILGEIETSESYIGNAKSEYMEKYHSKYNEEGEKEWGQDDSDRSDSLMTLGALKGYGWREEDLENISLKEFINSTHTIFPSY